MKSLNKLKCKFGLHEWQSYIIELPLQRYSLKAIIYRNQKCNRCGKWKYNEFFYCPQIKELYKEANASLRQTGRTTCLLRKAIDLLEQGKWVTYLSSSLYQSMYHENMFKKLLNKSIDYPSPAISFRSIDNFGMAGCISFEYDNIIEHAIGVYILIDHLVQEHFVYEKYLK